MRFIPSGNVNVPTTLSVKLAVALPVFASVIVRTSLPLTATRICSFEPAVAPLRMI
jgi:hypothetical protein